VTNPLVKPNRNWLKKGKKTLFKRSSSLSLPLAITMMGKKKINRQKNRNIKEYLLKILSNEAENLPRVSPIL
jgi:hypothetical protein